MSERVTIGNSTLYFGDAVEILPSLKERPALAVTDPPYRLTSGGRYTNPMGGFLARRVYANDGNIFPSLDGGYFAFMPLLFRLLADAADCYVMANDKHLYECLNAGKEAGFEFHNLLLWKKNTATPNKYYMKDCEFTAYFWKGRARTINSPGSKQCFECDNIRHKLNPTQKPVALFRHYILNSSKPGELVIDPFMGSGTAGVACTETGREFIGIELVRDQFAIACQRIRAAWQAANRTLLASKEHSYDHYLRLC